MKRVAVLLYGLVSYVLFVGVFAYLIGFLANRVVARSIDVGPEAAWPLALGVDVLLVALFGLQHSVMARPGFKAWWTSVVPAPIERSTYVLLTSAVLALLYACWQPIDVVVWAADGAPGTMLTVLFAAAWLMILVSTFLIDHFDLFGLRQVVLYFRGLPYTPVRFRMSNVYRFIRHPIMLGWLLAFWAAPVMTAGHLVFAAGMTANIFIGIAFEERDLSRAFGETYRRYRERVPMLLPRRGRTFARQSAS